LVASLHPLSQGAGEGSRLDFYLHKKQREKKMRMRKLQQRWGFKLAALGIFTASLAGCAVYPNSSPNAQYYSDGYYSYYNYPNDNYYYDSNGYPIRSGYSDDPDLRYDARDRAPDHSDDHNFHNRDDFDHWDY
jgi:hypothetical protein